MYRNSQKHESPLLNMYSDWQKHESSCLLSGGFSVGWPVAGMGMVTDPDQFGMIGTLDPNVLHTPKGFGFKAIRQ